MNTVNLKATAGVAGKYRLRVGKRGQEPRIDTGWFDNLITDTGLNLRGSSNFLVACHVGSGTAAPAVTDSSLSSFVAGTDTKQNTNTGTQSTAPYYGRVTITWRFAEGAAAGNISEVGVGVGALSSDALFSRALVTDGAGSPTTITVLADEFLDVTYELQIVPPTTDTTFNLTDAGPAGTVHSVTLRAAGVTINDWRGGWGLSGNSTSVGLAGSTNSPAVFDGVIQAITDANPAGIRDRAPSVTGDAYANASLERTGTATWGLDDGNFTSGVKSVGFVFENGGRWQAEFDPVIPKTSSDTLAIGFQVSWTRTTAL